MPGCPPQPGDHYNTLSLCGSISLTCYFLAFFVGNVLAVFKALLRSSIALNAAASSVWRLELRAFSKQWGR